MRNVRTFKIKNNSQDTKIRSLKSGEIIEKEKKKKKKISFVFKMPFQSSIIFCVLEEMELPTCVKSLIRMRLLNQLCGDQSA